MEGWRKRGREGWREEEGGGGWMEGGGEGRGGMDVDWWGVYWELQEHST